MLRFIVPAAALLFIAPPPVGAVVFDFPALAAASSGPLGRQCVEGLCLSASATGDPGAVPFLGAAGPGVLSRSRPSDPAVGRADAGDEGLVLQFDVPVSLAWQGLHLNGAGPLGVEGDVDIGPVGGARLFGFVDGNVSGLGFDTSTVFADRWEFSYFGAPFMIGRLEATAVEIAGPVPAPVPLPAALGLALAGVGALAAIGVAGKRQRRSAGRSGALRP